MIAEKNPYMIEAAEGMYARNADETIRAKCRAREDYNRRQRRIQKQLEDQKNAIAEKDQAIAEKDQAIAEKDQIIAEKDQKLQAALDRIAELEGKHSNR